jgi:triphosphoribosyl-dephospho-CoA synthetase
VLRRRTEPSGRRSAAGGEGLRQAGMAAEEEVPGTETAGVAEAVGTAVAAAQAGSEEDSL